MNLVKTQFKDSDSIRKARDKIAALRQKTSVSKYSDSFRSLLLKIPDMSIEEQLDRYIRGLKPAIRRELLLKAPTTLDDAVTLAERMDSIQRISVPPSAPVPSSSSGPHHAPMDVDSVQVPPPSRRRLTPEERANLVAKNGCFYCRQAS